MKISNGAIQSVVAILNSEGNNVTADQVKALLNGDTTKTNELRPGEFYIVDNSYDSERVKLDTVQELKEYLADESEDRLTENYRDEGQMIVNSDRIEAIWLVRREISANISAERQVSHLFDFT